MLIFLSSSGCSKKVKNVDLIIKAGDIYAVAEQKKIEEVKSAEEAIDFSQYSMGVNPYTSKAFKFNDLVFYAIEYPNQESALNEAKRLNQYYLKNWLFDKVQGEPILMELIETTFGAKPARK